MAGNNEKDGDTKKLGPVIVGQSWDGLEIRKIDEPDAQSSRPTTDRVIQYFVMLALFLVAIAVYRDDQRMLDSLFELTRYGLILTLAKYLGPH